MNEKGKNKLKNARKFQEESEERKIPRIKRILCKVKRKSKKIIKNTRKMENEEIMENYVRKRKKIQKAKLSFCVRSRNRRKNSQTNAGKLEKVTR